MPQLHFYVPDEVAETVKARAKSQGRTLSGYLAQLVRDQVGGEWPADFFVKIVGGWRGRPLRRPRQGRPERREIL